MAQLLEPFCKLANERQELRVAVDIFHGLFIPLRHICLWHLPGPGALVGPVSQVAEVINLNIILRFKVYVIALKKHGHCVGHVTLKVLVHLVTLQFPSTKLVVTA